MSNHDPRITLRQIADYAHFAQQFCSEKSLNDIRNDWRQGFAFERIMEVLGEAVKRLPLELRTRYPRVPWQLIAGMRDKISHGYDTVDYEMLWDTVQNDLPILLATVEQILRELS